MKTKLIAASIALSMIPALTSAEFDLSSIDYDELLDLQQQVRIEIETRNNVQSVAVPVGLWEIGVDIPAGTWILSASNGSFTHVAYGPTVDENGNSMSKYTGGNTGTFLSEGITWRLTATSGNYIYIADCPVVFTPADTLDLGFSPDAFEVSPSPASSSLPKYDHARAYKETDTYKDHFYLFSGHVCEIYQSDENGTVYYVSASGDYANCLFLYAPTVFSNVCSCSPGDMINAMVYYNGIQTLDSGARVVLLSAVYIDVEK